MRRRERRENQRTYQKLARERQRLFELGPGGSPARPIVVSSASVIEVQASSTPCPVCTGEQRIDSHDAVAYDGGSLRAIGVCCVQCGTDRKIYFRIAAPN
jgi:hypothetical protein